MTAQYEAQHPIYGFAGIQLASNPELLPEQALQQCHNFVLGQSGELIKRPMREAIGVAVPGNDPFFVVQALGFENNVVIVYAGGHTYKADVGFGTYTEITTLSGKNVYDGVQYLSKLYITASDGVYEWTTGTTAVLSSGSPPAALSIILFQNRLFAIKDSRLYYTDAGNPNGWLTGAVNQYIAVNDGDGDTLTAMIAIGDRILLFKQTSMYVLYTSENPSDWVVRGISPEIGCVGPKAILNVRGLIYFLHMDGLWITDGVALSRISDAILPAFVGTGRIQQSAYSDTLSLYKDFIILKVNCASAFVSVNYVTFFYRFAGGVKGFTTASEFLSGAAIAYTTPGWGSVWLIRQYTNSSPTYIATGPSAFYKVVDKVVDQSNFYEVVKGYFKTKAFVFNNPTRYKRIKYAHVTIAADVSNTVNQYGGINYYYVTDNVQTDVEQIWQEGIAGTRNFKIRGAGFGRSHALYFEESSKLANFQVLGLNFIHQVARQQDRQNV